MSIGHSHKDLMWLLKISEEFCTQNDDNVNHIPDSLYVGHIGYEVFHYADSYELHKSITIFLLFFNMV